MVQTYRFETKFEPPVGRVVHGMGQFSTGNDQYLAAISPDGMVPAHYPCFRLSFVTIGTTKRQPTLEAFQGGMDNLLQLLLDGNKIGLSPHLDLDLRSTNPVTGAQTSTIREVVAGVYDDWLRAFARTMVKYATSTLPQIASFGMLRIVGECSSPHERRLPDGTLIEPEEYIGAYRHIVGILNEEGARKYLALGWCIEVGSGDPDFAAWMPPLSDVDFFGIDLFHPREFSGPANAANRMAEDFSALAERSGRPLWVCECSAIVPPAEQWSGWFVPMLEWVQAHGAVGLMYINTDWKDNVNGWLSGRIDNNPDVVARLTTEFSSPVWMHAPGQVLLYGVKALLEPTRPAA